MDVVEYDRKHPAEYEAERKASSEVISVKNKVISCLIDLYLLREAVYLYLVEASSHSLTRICQPLA